MNNIKKSLCLSLSLSVSLCLSLCLSLSLVSDHEAFALHTSNTESLDGLAFLIICSWPTGIWYLFHKSEIGDTDTFKFVLFVFENNMPPHLLLNFLLIKYWKNASKIPKRILQI